MTKILVADDIVTNRVLLRQTLVELVDCEVLEAVDGRQAIELYEKENPDIILMDIMMPDINGHQAAAAIKEKMGNDYVPIIFVTALSSDESLVNALASGGDDYISKPFNIDVLESKISAHLRIRELTQEINNKNSQLEKFNKELIHEKQLIEHFFNKAIQQSYLDPSLIRYHMSPLSAFNGDIILVERAPNGGIYLILGDFSGHGLSAAMGTLPVAMIFFKMIADNYAVGDIAREINLQLNKLLPPGMFLTASILEINASCETMSIWMGGMPENYWFKHNGEFKQVINSQHMPLGILKDYEFDEAVQVFNIEQEDKIYLYSDGVVEAKNTSGQLFGNERLEDILVNGGDNRFDDVLTNLTSFSGKDNQNDDITLVELNCQPVAAPEIKESSDTLGHVLAWDFSVSLEIDDLRKPESVRTLSNMLCSIPHISRHKSVLHTLLAEIIANSIDHSILNFESVEKKDEETFAKYYEKRDKALAELDEAFINFEFRFYSENNSHFLEIKTSDSGSGYKKEHIKSSDEQLHGRGLTIINSFSEKVSFSDDGKEMTVLYKI